MPEASSCRLPQLLMLPPLLLLLLLLPLLLFVAGGGGGGACSSATSAACASVRQLTPPLAGLVDYFADNAGAFDADAYSGLSMASLRLAAAADGEWLLANCGQPAARRLRSVANSLRSLLRGFQADSVSKKSAYDRRVFAGISGPIDRFLAAAPFRRRRQLLAPGVGGELLTDAQRLSWLRRPGKLSSLLRYNERVGDKCLQLLLAADGGCRVSRACRVYFLNSRPVGGYYLTHQLLYLLLATLRDCRLRMSDGRTVGEQLLMYKCSRALRQHRMLQINYTAAAAAADVPEKLRSSLPELMDLWIEQSVLCSFAGFGDAFFNEQSAKLLTAARDSRLGCFKEKFEAAAASPRSSRSTGSFSTGRRLMHDVSMPGGCSSHTSGLAAAYYSLAIRHATAAARRRCGGRRRKGGRRTF